MTWDSPLTAAVALELHDRLAGARLKGHTFDWEARKLVLYFRSETLEWALHPQAGWVTLHPPEDPPPESRPLSAEVVGVVAPPDERMLRLKLKKVRGRTRSVQVIVELLTNQWNALLVEGKEEWIRHVLWTRRSNERPLVVGQGYLPPPPSTRAGVAEGISETEWRSLVADSGKGDYTEVLETLAFTSPLNLPTLLEPSPGEGPSEQIGGSGFAFWERLRSLDSPEPTLLETTRGYQPYPFPIIGFGGHPFSSVLAAMAAAREEAEGKGNPARGTLDSLDRAIKHAEGRVRGLRRESAQASDPQDLREKANLLLARLGEVERGASEIRLRGFQGEDVTLDLDPTLSPHENAEVLYAEAARQERAMSRLPVLIEKATSRLDDLVVLRERFLASEVSAEEVAVRLPQAKGKARWGTAGPGPRLPFKRFRSTGGLEIRVGRGSTDNDALTFRHSHAEDIWLHARDTGGAHVVLRWAKEADPPAKDLVEAAVLAALHSRARHSRIAPVDWTRRKHVRKPRKAPPGTVTPGKTQTLFVEPDPGLLDRLRWND